MRLGEKPRRCGDQAPQAIAKTFRSPAEGSRRSIQPDGPKPVGQQEMLAAPAGKQDRHVAQPVEQERIVRCRAGPDFDRMYLGKNLPAPQGAGVRHPKMRSLEADQPERRCRRIFTTLAAVPRQSGLGQSAITGIAPKPFPGEQRSVGCEKRRIRRRLAPIDRRFPLRLHRRSGADGVSPFTRMGGLHPRN